MKKTYILFGLLFVMLLFTSMVSAVEQAPTLSNEFPSDGSTLWDIDATTVNVTITDIDTNFNWSIDFSPDIGNSSSTNATNGSKTCTISGLQYSTTYTWVVNATSFSESTFVNESYTFTTRPAKLRENPEFNVIEKAIVGVVGILILIGFLFIIMKTDYKKEGALAKLLVGLMIALALLTVIFSAL